MAFGFHDIFYFFVIYVSLFFLIFWLLVALDYAFVEEKKPKKKLKRFPLVSIAIPAYNEEKRVLKTIKSAFELDYPKEKIELFVMNDGSTDNTEKVVEDFIKKHKGWDIRLITRPNRGKGAVMNHALELAKGEYFIVFDADSDIQPHALKTMLPYFEDPEVAVVLPAIKVREPKTLLEKFQWLEYLSTFFYKYAMFFLDAIPVTPGPFSVFRRKVLLDIGGYSENNLTEDLEICLRLQKHHYRVAQVLNVVSYTSAPNSIISFYKQRNRWYKGGLLNSLKYRKIMFNRQYGDFGMIEFPSFLVTGLLVAMLLLLGAIRLFGEVSSWVGNFADINFDISYLFEGFKVQWFTISYVMLMLAIMVIFFASILVKWSHDASNEKLFKGGWIVLPIYLFIYGLFIMITWIGVFIDLIFRREQKW